MGTTSVETALADIVPWFWRQILKTYQTINHLLKKKLSSFDFTCLKNQSDPIYLTIMIKENNSYQCLINL